MDGPNMTKLAQALLLVPVAMVTIWLIVVMPIAGLSLLSGFCFSCGVALWINRKSP